MRLTAIVPLGMLMPGVLGAQSNPNCPQPPEAQGRMNA
jgi:hypothetical protein